MCKPTLIRNYKVILCKNKEKNMTNTLDIQIALE